MLRGGSLYGRHRCRRRAFLFLHKNTSKKIFSRGKKEAPPKKRGAFLKCARRHVRGLPKTFFSYPDYTVGTGIAPVRRPQPFADYTAGGELHPAPKNRFVVFNLLYLICCSLFVFLYLSLLIIRPADKIVNSFAGESKRGQKISPRSAAEKKEPLPFRRAPHSLRHPLRAEWPRHDKGGAA